MSDDVERVISEAAYGRRTFLRRLAIGSAFAVPVVSSFSMAGIQAVSANATPSLQTCNSTLTTVWTSNTTMVEPDGGPGETIGCANQNGGGSAWEEIFELIHRVHHI